jgi:hypothetical protein
MSLRTVARFTLVGLLGMSLAAPAAAQEPLRVRVVETRTGSFLFSGSYNMDAPAEVAPMPREVQLSHLNRERLIKHYGSGRLIAVADEVRETPVELAPMPRVVPVVRACAEEEVFQYERGTPPPHGPTAGAPMPRQVQVHGPGQPFVEEPQPPSAPMPRLLNTLEYEFGIELGGGPVLFQQSRAAPPFAAPALRQSIFVQGPGQLFFEEAVPGTVVSRPAVGVAGSICCNERNFCVQRGPAPAQRVILIPGYIQFDNPPPPQAPACDNEGGFRAPLNSGPFTAGEGAFHAPQQTPATPGFYPNLSDADLVMWRGYCAHPQTKHLPNSMITLGKFRCDDNGTWWAEVVRVPQPKFTPARQPQFYYIERAIAQGAQNAQPGCCFNTATVGAASGNFNAWTVGLKVDRAEKSSPFAGTWAREMEGMVIAATLSPCGEELKLCLSQCAEGTTICFTVTADCKVTKEGLLHGVVTGVDVDVKRDPKASGDSPTAGELLESATALQELVDSPFSFRVKQTSAGLMVSSLKMASVGPVRASELAFLCGMFKPCKDGAIPTAKPMKTHTSGMTLPSPQYLEHYPQYFSADPYHPLPRELAEDPVIAPSPRVCPAPTGCGTSAACPPVQGVYAPPPRLQDISSRPRLPGASQVVPAPPLAVPPVPCQRVGIDFSTPCAPQVGWNPAQPANVPANEFGMMAEVFGQMMGTQPQMPQMLSPPSWIMTPPQPLQPAGGFLPGTPANPGFGVCQPSMPPPAPTVIIQNASGQLQGFSYGQGPPVVRVSGPPAYLPPVPAPPVAVQTLGYVVPQVPEGTCPPCPLPAATRPSITGTWVREVGPVVYVVKVAPDHLTITALTAAEMEDGKAATDGIILTADYHFTRDGSTLVGLVTGVDAILDGSVTDGIHMQHLQGELSAMQKCYTDKPFAMSVRVYGDSLVIGNVRLPQADGPPGHDSPLSIIGGRYKNATDKPLPKPKAMKHNPNALPPGPPISGPVGSCPPAYGYPSVPVSDSPYAAPATWNPPPPPPGYGVPPPTPQANPWRTVPPTAVVPAPATVPRELDAVSLPPADHIPPPSPRVTEPGAPPPVVVCPPPGHPLAKAATKPIATHMTVMWKNCIEYYPDPTQNGEKVAGVSGKLFLFDPDLNPATADGELTITLHDDTPRPAGIRGGASERWVIDADSLRRAATLDERFGRCYTLFLPWPSRRPDVTRVRLSVSFKPESGGGIHSIHAPETKLTLDAGGEPYAVPTADETPKVKKKKKKAATPERIHGGILLNEYSSDPNVRMQQLLYQSEDLREIKNEWRRFWFNDQPSHLTPERIHGGIR